MKNFNNCCSLSSICRFTFVFITTVGLLSSCVTTKKTTYLQDYEKSEYPEEYVAPDIYRIRPNDNLFVRVVTPDPRWSEMFNTLPTTAATYGTTEQSVDLMSYTVNLDGTVEIPYLGSISVAGKTIQEAKEILENELLDFVTDASITVKLVNNYVSLLGEVNRPGRYPIYKAQLNIFEALAMAGDLADYSNRFEINIVRQSTDGTIIKEFDLTDKNIIDSEFYYIMPNDVIYVQPMKGKFFGFNQFPYAVILTTITTFVLIWNVIQ